MRKIFLTFIVLTFAHIVFAQNKQTIVVRPETAREREKRKMNDAVETFQMLGEFGKLMKEANAENLKRVKNSKYSVFVEQKLEDWKKKGEFEKTADWQKRLNDSTAIKKAEIIVFGADDYARDLNVLKPSYYDNPNKFNDLFYDEYEGQYDSDKEVLVVNTFWGKIPIPVPLDEAKKWDNIRYVPPLKAHFFIQNDQLALLSLSTYDEKYIWENPSQAAQIARNKRLELERNKGLELERKRLEQERLDSLELAPYNQKLDSIFKDYNRQLLQNPYNLTKSVLTGYLKITGKESRESNFNISVSIMKSAFESLNNNFSEEYERGYRRYGNFFASKDEFETFYKQGIDIYSEGIKVFEYLTRNSYEIRHIFSSRDRDGKEIFSTIRACQSKLYYPQVIDFVIRKNMYFNNEWSKNGQFFENKAEFYNAYLSDDYKNILKTNQKTLKANKKK
jgi:hypothetical protein